MSWLRWWDGTVTDPKWRVVAARAGQTVGSVIAVWAYLLEEARSNDGALPEIDCEIIGAALGYDPEAVQRIVDGMKAKGSVNDTGIVNWRKRQPKREDDSRARVAAWREKKAAEKSVTNQRDGACNADVTRGNAPEAEAEAEKIEERSTSLRSVDPKNPEKTSPRQALLVVLTDEWAGAVLDHRQKIRKPLTAKAAELLAKAFNSTGDPNGAAQMMIERGWQGFKLEWWQNDRNKPQNNRTAGGDAKLDALRFGLDGGDVFGNLDRGTSVFSPGKPDPERNAAPGFGQPSIDLERQTDGAWSAPGVH